MRCSITFAMQVEMFQLHRKKTKASSSLVVLHTLHLFNIGKTPPDFSLEHSLIYHRREEDVLSHIQTQHQRQAEGFESPIAHMKSFHEVLPHIDVNFSILLSQKPNTLLNRLQKSEVMHAALTQINPFSKNPLT